MANLPGVGSVEGIGLTVTTVADNAGIDSTKAGLAELNAQIDALKANTAALDANTAAFSKTLDEKATSSTKTFAQNLKSLGSQMTDVGRSMTTYITLPIAAVAAESVKMAMTFQQSMEMLHTNAGIPQSQIKSLGDSILNMAQEVGQKPNDLAQAFYHIATAGQGIFTTSQMLDQLKVAAEGAAIGQANLDDTTYALTSTLAANVKGATDFNATMGTLLGIVQAGDMHLSDLNDVISTGLMGTLSTFGVSLQSAGAALADFGDLGEKGAVAGTRLRMMLTLMASPSAAASKILGDLGLTTSETATATGTMNQVFAETGLSTTKLADDLRQPNGIFVAITDLKTHLEDAGLTASQTDTILAKAFGGGRTDSALLQLLDTTNRLDLKYKQIGNDSNNFASNWKQQQQVMKQQWDEAWSGIQADMIKLGEAIMPEVTHAMTDVSHALTDVTNWFSHLSQGQKQFVIDAAGILAVTGPILLIFGTLAKSISNIITLVETVGPAFQIMGRLGIGVLDQLVANMTGGAGLVAAMQAGTATIKASFSSMWAGVASIGAMQMGALVGLVAADVALMIADIQRVTQLWDQAEKEHATTKTQIQQVQGDIQNAQSLYAQGKIDQSQFQASMKTFNNSLQTLQGNSSWWKSLGFATGTANAPGGVAIVGENGPEAMYVPQGASVYTNNQTRSMAANGSFGNGGVTLNQENNIYNQVDLTEANRQLAWQLSTAVGA